MKTQNTHSKISLTLAEISVSYESVQFVQPPSKVTAADDVYKFLQPIFNDFIEHHEEFRIVLPRATINSPFSHVRIARPFKSTELNFSCRLMKWKFKTPKCYH